MPLQKTDDRDLEHIDLPAEGEWVEVKRRLGKDDEREITRRMLLGQKVTPGQALDDWDAGEMHDRATFSTIEVALKKWSFTEPITPANIRALDDDSLAVITAKLDELYPAPRTDDEVKNSSAPSAARTSTAESSPKNSGGSQ